MMSPRILFKSSLLLLIFFLGSQEAVAKENTPEPWNGNIIEYYQKVNSEKQKVDAHFG